MHISAVSRGGVGGGGVDYSVQESWNGTGLAREASAPTLSDLTGVKNKIWGCKSESLWIERMTKARIRTVNALLSCPVDNKPCFYTELALKMSNLFFVHRDTLITLQKKSCHTFITVQFYLHWLQV